MSIVSFILIFLFCYSQNFQISEQNNTLKLRIFYGCNCFGFFINLDYTMERAISLRDLNFAEYRSENNSEH